MIDVQKFDDETIVPRPFPGDVPIEPLEGNKDLPIGEAAFLDGVILLERTASQSNLIEMGLVSAADWQVFIKDQCEKYLGRPTAVSPPVASEIIPHLETMVLAKGYSQTVLQVFDELRPRLLAEIRLQMA